MEKKKEKRILAPFPGRLGAALKTASDPAVVRSHV